MDELLERIAAWVRKIVKPDIDEALNKPVPLADEDVAMIRGLIASVEALKKVQADQAARLRELEGKR